MVSNIPFTAPLQFLTIAFLIASGTAHGEPSLDIGMHATRTEMSSAGISGKSSGSESGVHFGIGIARAVGEQNEVGVRLELDMLDSDMLLAVRAIDYRRHLGARVAISAFAGAARLDLATPAYGYYYGAGVRLKQLVGQWDLGIDFRVGDEVARDNLLPADPANSADAFFDISGVSVFLSRQF